MCNEQHVLSCVLACFDCFFVQTGVFVLGNIFSKPTVFAMAKQNVEVSPDAKITFSATLVHLSMFICCQCVLPELTKTKNPAVYARKAKIKIWGEYSNFGLVIYVDIT